MTIETILAGILIGYLAWRLYQMRNKSIPNKSDEIRLISKETGEIVEMKIIKMDKKVKNLSSWNADNFIISAKSLFQKTMDSFSKGNLKDLKKDLSDAVYTVFEKDILNRKENETKMDFSLICFDSAEIIQKSKKNDLVQVKFVTEQINLLKNKEGEVIEGDPMNISIMEDIWTFQKISRDNWVVLSTLSKVHNAE